MSWSQYVTRLTNIPVGQGKCIFAAFHNLSDGKCFAQEPSRSPNVSPEEIKCIKRGFNSPGILFTSGVTLKGLRFVYLTSIDNTILARKRNLGCVIIKCPKLHAVLIGIYSCNETVNNVFKQMAEIVESCNYPSI
ncbi:profilin-5-like [Centruroides sculpturatus]|uniref:profilin-5-like n=1 Tax=Centruroides sculpturatus TaxID=218467 RepID=UPI000C6CAD66|nr:profilin-5-like [Centruroides sculpturatus]